MLQKNKTHFAFLTAGLLLAAGPVYSQGLTARDMFESAAGLTAPPAAAKKTAAKKKIAKAAPTKAETKTTQEAKASPAPSKASPPAEPTAVKVGTATVLPVSLTSTGAPAPLGLRYSILKQTSGSQAAEVDAETVFRSGERIRLSVEANDQAYLYIVQRGSSGNWSVLFPSSEISGGNNVIEKGKKYDIPSNAWFAFDEQAGQEKLFIVLSRKPEPNLEKMIYSLRNGGQPAPSAAPAAAPPQEKTLMAANDPPIDDALVSRIRSQVYERDLVFEKVDENTPGQAKEKAVYVVNKTGSADSRVVADVTLKHK